MLEYLVNTVGEYVDTSPRLRKTLGGTAEYIIDTMQDRRKRMILTHAVGIGLVGYVAYKLGQKSQK